MSTTYIDGIKKRSDMMVDKCYFIGYLTLRLGQ